MSVAGVTSAVRSAIATVVGAAGLSCYTYDSWDIPADDFVTLGAADWSLREDADQRYGIREIRVPVLLYSLVDGNAEQSIADQETALESLLDALGASRTLGGKVAYSDIGDQVSQTYLRSPNGQTYSVVTVPLLVMPFPNKA